MIREKISVDLVKLQTVNLLIFISPVSVTLLHKCYETYNVIIAEKNNLIFENL